MGWESSDVVRFDLWPLLQGQTGIAKFKSAYNSLIISRRALAREGDYEMHPVREYVHVCVTQISPKLLQRQIFL